MAYILSAGIDQPTANLIIQLQLQDAGLYFESSKGKSRTPTNEEVAFQLQNEELEQYSQLLLDRRMAESFYTAVQTDGHILAANETLEKNAAKDRDIARRWSEENRRHPRAAKTSSDQSKSLESMVLDDETLTKLQIMYMSGLEQADVIDMEETGETPESSAFAASRIRESASSMRRCIACTEDTEFINVARVPCGHEYCRGCLDDLFKASMTDETLFPPRCCRQPIVMNIARIFLKSDLVQQYEKKKIEFDTPNRTYCYSANCAAFINTSYINGDIATCPNCGSTTCTSCKQRAHIGDCPNDTALQQLLTTARDRGWQRCHSCWRVVELEHGCNHMTCRCGAQFCYNCGEPWKNCRCEHWNERRLLARAYQIIDRDGDAVAAADEPEPEIQRPHPYQESAPILAPLPVFGEANREEVLEAVLRDELSDYTDPEPDAIEDRQPDGQEDDEFALGYVPDIDETHPQIPKLQNEHLQVIPPEDNSEESRTAHAQTPRDVLVAKTMQELRENHECSHERWKYVPGPHSCEECAQFLKQYIFECRQCRLQACNRCRRNRL